MDKEELSQLLGTPYQPQAHRHQPQASRRIGRRVREWLDFVTLIAVLLGGTQLGLIALGIDFTTTIGPVFRTVIYGLIGLSAVYQWCRQRSS